MFRDPGLINQCKITKLPWDEKLRLRSCNWLLTKQKVPALPWVFGRGRGGQRQEGKKGKEEEETISELDKYILRAEILSFCIQLILFFCIAVLSVINHLVK